MSERSTAVLTRIPGQPGESPVSPAPMGAEQLPPPPSLPDYVTNPTEAGVANAPAEYWGREADRAERQAGTAEEWAVGADGYTDFVDAQVTALGEFDARTAGKTLTTAEKAERAYLEQTANLTPTEVSSYAASHTARQNAKAADARRWERHGSTGEPARDAYRNPVRFKHTKAEVEQLNLSATENVYGEFVDPRTGNTVVNARGSIADRLRKDRVFGGRTEAERNATADWFDRRIEEEVKAGVEVVQAQTIVYLELLDRPKIDALQQRLEVGGGVAELDPEMSANWRRVDASLDFAADLGMPEAEAREKAQAQYARLAAARRKFIVSNNILTVGEYKQARAVQSARMTARRDGQAAQARPEARQNSDNPQNPNEPPRVELGEMPDLPEDVMGIVLGYARAKRAADTTAQRWPSPLNRRRNRDITGAENRRDLLQRYQQELRTAVEAASGGQNEKAIQMYLDATRAVLLLQAESSKDGGAISGFMARPGVIRGLVPFLPRRAKNTRQAVEDRAELILGRIVEDLENTPAYANQIGVMDAAMNNSTNAVRQGNAYRSRVKGAAKAATSGIASGREGIRNWSERRRERRDPVGRAAAQAILRREARRQEDEDEA